MSQIDFYLCDCDDEHWYVCVSMRFKNEINRMHADQITRFIIVNETEMNETEKQFAVFLSIRNFISIELPPTET